MTDRYFAELIVQAYRSLRIDDPNQEFVNEVARRYEARFKSRPQAIGSPLYEVVQDVLTEAWSLDPSVWAVWLVTDGVEREVVRRKFRAFGSGNATERYANYLASPLEVLCVIACFGEQAQRSTLDRDMFDNFVARLPNLIGRIPELRREAESLYRELFPGFWPEQPDLVRIAVDHVSTAVTLPEAVIYYGIRRRIVDEYQLMYSAMPSEGTIEKVLISYRLTCGSERLVVPNAVTIGAFMDAIRTYPPHLMPE